MPWRGIECQRPSLQRRGARTGYGCLSFRLANVAQQHPVGGLHVAQVIDDLTEVEGAPAPGGPVLPQTGSQCGQHPVELSSSARETTRRGCQKNSRHPPCVVSLLLALRFAGLLGADLRGFLRVHAEHLLNVALRLFPVRAVYRPHRASNWRPISYLEGAKHLAASAPKCPLTDSLRTVESMDTSPHRAATTLSLTFCHSPRSTTSYSFVLGHQFRGDVRVVLLGFVSCDHAVFSLEETGA